MNNPANVRIFCLKTSYSCYNDKRIEYGAECFTPINDFGFGYINWISVYINGVYMGAHKAENFGTLAEWRNMQIDEILK